MGKRWSDKHSRWINDRRSQVEGAAEATPAKASGSAGVKPKPKKKAPAKGAKAEATE